MRWPPSGTKRISACTNGGAMSRWREVSVPCILDPTGHSWGFVSWSLGWKGSLETWFEQVKDLGAVQLKKARFKGHVPCLKIYLEAEISGL